MSLQKQNVPISFAKGLDTKTDPKQIAIGNFLELQNTVFDKLGQLTKRNGYSKLTSLDDGNSKIATTFNGNLTAIGSVLRAYSKGSNTWVDKGKLQPIELSTLPLNRSNTNQSQADCVVAPNGLVCTVFTDNIPSGGITTPSYKYTIADSITSQSIVNATPIPVSSGAITQSPRVFILGKYFIILFNNLIAGINHLQYIAINYNNPTIIFPESNISSQITPNSRLNFDAIVVNNSMYIGWNGNDGGGAIRLLSLNSTLVQSNTVVFAGESASVMSLCADSSGTTPVIYAVYYKTAGTLGRILAVNQSLVTVLAPTTWIVGAVVLNITSFAKDGSCEIFYELDNAYSYDAAIKTNIISKKNVTQSGVVTGPIIVSREVGLASKAFQVNNTIYFLTIYNSAYQPTYFLQNSSGDVIAKLAYSNGGSYYTLGLPNITISNNLAQLCYLRKDLTTAVNKTQGAVNTTGIYSQTGINLVSFTFDTSKIIPAEIGSNLNLSGGFIWAYDGTLPVEQGFHLWPDYVEVTTSTMGGFLADQQYFYKAVYEWSDAQGNTHRSAPSLPIGQITAGGGTSSNTINVPTLRLTYKVSNPVRIVIYRWSTAQQTYYQITSILAPILNDVTVDSIAYVDTLADADILGNTILYTTGGVIENIAAPASKTLSLFKSRLFSISSEDENLLLYSKQVIENTPVEMSDLFTIFVAPTTGAQGSTGGVKVLAPMDDKEILFKKDAIYYITGTGPDNTGANNDFSDPVFVSSTIGCDNQQSVVFIPQGLMFQSDKGIWLLSRDLNTTYIGAPVELFTQNATVESAVNIPGTNQVRFIMDSGITLMYDYFYGQWGTFVNIPAVSSTIYEGLHTYINTFGQVFQESIGKYLDGSNPVLIKFTTGWLNLAGLQGFQRAYFFYILAQYISPHKLTVQIAYDYNPSPTQSSVITPDNFSPNYGDEALWGSGQAWGGPGNIEQWRVFLQQQKCEAFRITLMESFDSTLGQPAGAGFTMSGIDLSIGLKDSRPRLRAARSVG